MKIDDILSQPFPDHIQKVITYLEVNAPEVYTESELSQGTLVDRWSIETSPLLNGWCVEFRGVEYYGAKSAIKEFKKKHKAKFGKVTLEN